MDKLSTSDRTPPLESGIQDCLKCGHSFESHTYPEDEHSFRSGMMSECQSVSDGYDCPCKGWDDGWRPHQVDAQPGR